MGKKILLARPNEFMVTNMKQLMNLLGFEAVALKDLSEIQKFSSAEVVGVVISTAAVSIVKQDYTEVIKTSMASFPDVPVFLATLSEPEIAKHSANRILRELGVDRAIKSIEESIEQNSNADEIVIISKADLIEEARIQKSVEVIGRKLSPHSTSTLNSSY